MNNDHDTRMAWIKMFATWVLAAFGTVTLSTLVQLAALVFTLLQIYILVRDKIIRRRIKRESQRAEFDSRPHHHSEGAS